MMNSELKAQIEELKHERQQLILMLNRHRPTCIVSTDSIKTPEKEANPLLEQVEAKWEGTTHFHVTVYRSARLQLAEALGSKHLDILWKREWRSLTSEVGVYLNKAKRKTHGWPVCWQLRNFCGIVFLPIFFFFFFRKCLICFSPFSFFW